MKQNGSGLTITARILLTSLVPTGFLLLFGGLSFFWLMEPKSGYHTTTAACLLLAMAALSVILSFRGVKHALAAFEEVTDTFRALNQGDSGRRVAIDSSYQSGEMASVINTYVDTMHQTMSRMADTSRKISFASNTLEATAKHMTRGVKEIVSEVNSVASSSEEMASTSTEIARSCTVAARSSEIVNHSAIEGEGIIQGIIAAMDRIGKRVKESASSIVSLGERSDQVGEIAAIINEIADQTNLLALNAAIEAARAGEHGRGFAVVADEVRKLAERTAGATKDIGMTIQAMQAETKGAVASMEHGVKEAEQGVEETERSGTTLREILKQMNTLTAQVNQIAVASEQQTTTTDEITHNIQKISEIMSLASGNIQENGQASSEVAGLSIELNTLMGKFLAGERRGTRSTGTPQEAMDLVKRAAQYLKTHGKEKAFKEFSNPAGQFTRGDLYIFVNDKNGLTLAHGQNRSLVGKNVSDLKDVEGKHFIREMLNLARTKGSGWVDYKWMNPTTKEVLAKSTYCMNADDITLGCGIYK